MRLGSQILLPAYLLIGAGLSWLWLDNIRSDDLNIRKYSDRVVSPSIKVNKSVLLIKSYETESRQFYTLNGSMPDETSKEYYQGVNLFEHNIPYHLLAHRSSLRHKAPITDQLPLKAYVIRASAHHPRLGFSQPEIHTHLIKNQSKKFRILSLAVNEDFFFDPWNGQLSLGKHYISGIHHVIDKPWWNRPANYKLEGHQTSDYGAMELLDKDGKSVYQENIRVQIHGNASRAFQQKSFRIEADAYHGKKRIENEFDWADSHLKEVESFIIRNSGNDWGHTMFADAFMQKTVSGLNLITQDSEPVHLMINGIYWGIYNVRPRYDDHFLEEYGEELKGRLAEVKYDQELSEGKKRDLEDYLTITSVLKSVRSQKKKRDFLKKAVDLDNFIDYILVESYFANTDWPGNNLKCFRQSKKDPWKWLLYDMDYGLSYIGNPEAYKINNFKRIAAYKGTTGQIFNYILSDPVLKTRFIKRAVSLLKTELSTDRLLTVLKEFEETYHEDIIYQIRRWRKPASLSEWESYIDDFETFISMRAQFFKNQLEKL